MATVEDIDRAQASVEDAVSRALRRYLLLIRDTVFADPARPDWVVWPSGAWQQIVAEVVTPVVLSEFQRVYAKEAAEAGVAAAVARAAADTFATQFQQVVESEAVPDRVLQEAQAEVAADPSGAGLLALLAISNVLWAGGITVFGMNAGSFAVNAAVFAAAAALAGGAAGLGASVQRPVSKVWNAVDDARTRPTHAAADGSEVLLTEPFIIGGFPLRYPHDPFGPPQEIMNCRCVLSLRSV